MGDLSNKVAVVTGGASGIGEGIARACARRGADIVIADIAKDKIEKVSKALRDEFSVRVIGVPTDVADSAAVEALADTAYDEFGRVNILFNNAGITAIGASWEASPDEWRKVLDVNLFGCFYGIQAFVPRMIRSGEAGHVVNTASLAGLVPTPQMSSYAASKHAIVGLSGSLVQELAFQKVPIKVTVVCPGYIATPAATGSVELHGDQAKSELDKQVLSTIGTAAKEGLAPDEAGELILESVERGDFWVAPNGMRFRDAIAELHSQLFKEAF